MRDLDRGVVDRLAARLNLPPLVAVLLHNRALVDSQEANRFLEAPLDGLHDSNELPDMQAAAERLTDAVQQGEALAIFGDYDVDGASGTALLTRFFSELGAPVSYYIPDRFNEGYGLNVSAVDQLVDGGARILVTVDCGTTNFAEVAHARSRGVEVMVVDHHHIPAKPLEASALINPRLPNCVYPNPNLCSVGLCFKLAHAVRRELHGRGVTPLPNLKRHLDLVALGTIADVAPLRGENHTLVRHGLEELTRTKKPGMQALKALCQLTGEPVNTGHVGFRLAPRLNAAGRMATGRLAAELMITDDRSRAQQLAEHLHELNRARQETQEHIVEEATAQAKEQLERTGGPGLVLASEGWHSGIIGIVASRIRESFHQPTLVISVDGDDCRGSGRTVEGVDLYGALKECQYLFTKFGGHTAAAGFSMRTSYLDGLQRRFRRAVEAQVGGRPPGPKLIIDAEVRLEQMSRDLLLAIEQLAPYGQGNPAPVFCSRGVTVIYEPRTMGKGKQHARLKLSQHGTTCEAVGFDMAARLSGMSWAGRRADVVFRPSLDSWNGYERVQLILQDIRLVE